MENNNILEIMVTQHALLEVLFTAFKNEINGNLERGKSFLSEFKWESKKHFFIEEEAIFNFLPWSDPEISEMIKRIKNEHGIMADRLQNISKNLANISEIEMEGFYRLLENHRKFEEQDLYPVLDTRLTDAQKRQIIFRVNQITLNK